MTNLRLFDDRYVLVQFKQPWIVPSASGQKPMPTSVPIPGQPAGQQPEQTILAVPFLVGKVKRIKGQEEGYGNDDFLVQIMDPNGVKIDVHVVSDMIFSVCALSADKIIV